MSKNIPEIYWGHSPASLALISPHVFFASATSRHAPQSQPQPTSFKLLTFPSTVVPPWTAMAWVCQSTRHSLDDTTSTSPFPQPPPVIRPILPPITLLCTQSHLPTRALANVDQVLTPTRQRCIHDRRKASMSRVHASAASLPFSTWRHFLSSPQISLCRSLPR